MTEYRCKKCGNLLFKESVKIGEVEIKCPHCNTFNIIERSVSRTAESLVWLSPRKVDTENKKCDTEDHNMKRP